MNFPESNILIDLPGTLISKELKGGKIKTGFKRLLIFYELLKLKV